MIDGLRVLALIPARGGSKGLPRKNVRPLCGKPLMAWSVERALQSRYVDDVVVTTDDDEIAEIATRAGADVPFRRPAALASDAAPMMGVVEHALTSLRAARGVDFEYVVLLEPTSPLREADDIDRMLASLHARRNRFDSIISVGEVAEHPSIVKRLTGEELAPYCPDLATTARRQDNEPAYFPYGVGYIAKVASLRAEGTFYGRRTTHYQIKRYQRYEIDDLYDFLTVERIMRHEWNLA